MLEDGETRSKGNSDLLLHTRTLTERSERRLPRLPTVTPKIQGTGPEDEANPFSRHRRARLETPDQEVVQRLQRRARVTRRRAFGGRSFFEGDAVLEG